MIVAKNAVNAILTNAVLMGELPKVFELHDRSGIINILKVCLATIAAREAVVWGPVIMRWSSTNANPNDPPPPPPPAIPAATGAIHQ